MRIKITRAGYFSEPLPVNGIGDILGEDSLLVTLELLIERHPALPSMVEVCEGRKLAPS
jgi:hypothetical protein